MSDRKQREREFHDERYSSNSRAQVDAMYADDIAVEAYRRRVLESGGGQRVLEYGCGTGGVAFDLAPVAQQVCAIDLSPVAVELAHQSAVERGLDIDFSEMDAEALTYPDDSFDLVCGSGILHHLDIEAALGEVARVLAPGGTAIFIEPLGHNPALNLFRSMTPSLRTDDEHPLLVADFDRMRRHFAEVDIESFHMVGMAGKAPGLPAGARRALERADANMFERWPSLRRFGWMAVLTLSSPIENGGDEPGSSEEPPPRVFRHRVESALVERLPRSVARGLGGLYGFVIPPRRSYSQFGEDLIVAAFFDEVGIESGTYVDIGAFHPRWLSNTHLLAQRGWSGVVVDIDDPKIRLCTAVRRNCTGITAAVAPRGAPAEVEVFKFRRLWSEIDTLSAADAERYRNDMGIGFDREFVPTATVDSVLSRAWDMSGAIEFLNIDLEGIDDLILSEVDFDRFPVGVVCFENNERFGGSEKSVSLLESHGYRHLATAGGSHIYARSTLADAAVRWARST